MTRLASWKQTPDERKQYTVDYTDWLGDGETISSTDLTGIEIIDGDSASDLIVVASSSILTGDKKVAYFIEGGVDGVTYKLHVKITTSTGETKEDVVIYRVRDI